MLLHFNLSRCAVDLQAVTEIGTKEATACYLVALSERELQHSDMISIKLSPSAAASALSVFVQHGSGSEDLGDKLSAPVVANGVATFSYCASREGHFQPCRLLIADCCDWQIMESIPILVEEK